MFKRNNRNIGMIGILELKTSQLVTVGRGKRSLVILQVPIRLMNVWYGRTDGIMAPLPS